MQNSNLYALIQSCIPTDPAAVFLYHDRGELKYSELDVATGRIVGLLRALNIRKGDRVIVQVDKSPEAILLYLACLRAGAIYIPLNTAYTADEVAYFIDDAEPRLLVCTPEAHASIAGIAAQKSPAHVLTLDGKGRGTFIDRLRNTEAADDVEHCTDDEIACILYTSGTTGRAKGAMLSHHNLSSNARALHAYWRWQPDDVLLHPLPIFHVHGLFISLHCALLKGTPVIFLARFDLELVKQSLPQATVMMGVPTYYVRLLADAEFDRQLCRNIRLFSSGSAPLLAETFEAFEARTGQRILERYGMTESLVTTSNPFDGERVAGSVGFPLAGVSVRVTGEGGMELPRGETGMLEFAGPNVFKGYWRMPEKTAEEFTADGYFISGDLANMDAEGRICIVGRAKDLVISGGYNVYPKEIELLIDEIDGVRESAVIGLPHPDFGEGVTAIVVRASTQLSEDSILAALAPRLARFKQPKRIFFVDELPRNTMGKVQKKELREQYRDTYAE